PQIGQVGFREPCPDLLHAANDLRQSNPIRKQTRDLPSTCQIAKPEQTTSGIEQPEPHKLVNGVAGKLAQRSNLVTRIGPMPSVRHLFPNPPEKAPLAHHWNPVAAGSAQLVGWSSVVQ